MDCTTSPAVTLNVAVASGGGGGEEDDNDYHWQ
jgi:hypothetical protein